MVFDDGHEDGCLPADQIQQLLGLDVRPERHGKLYETGEQRKLENDVSKALIQDNQHGEFQAQVHEGETLSEYEKEGDQMVHEVVQDERETENRVLGKRYEFERENRVLGKKYEFERVNRGSAKHVIQD